MKKLVILKFDGALKSGYRLNLTISNAGETPNLIISAKSPSALAVIEHSQFWCDTYRSFLFLH
ncbi:hypothetical protein RIVM261_084130 [Rivularia sp. IAM M-261]|nr:hypothetical protein CAL7716_089640 [Calothrix sp. PCC 7716]GJD23457.1 hypothetical protein RIVM261_084130 [Rivularia sp. IAM M-261]